MSMKKKDRKIEKLLVGTPLFYSKEGRLWL